MISVKSCAVDLTNDYTMEVTPEDGVAENFRYGEMAEVSEHVSYNWFMAGTPVPQYTKGDPDYHVKIRLTDERVLMLPMGNVSNQGTWVNTSSVVAIAVAVIIAKIEAATL